MDSKKDFTIYGEQAALVEKMYSNAMQLKAYGLTQKQLLETLKQYGLTDENALLLANKIEGRYNAIVNYEEKDEAYGDIVVGGLLLFGGIVISIISFMASGYSGFYVVTTGAIIVGFTKFSRGVSQRIRNR